MIITEISKTKAGRYSLFIDGSFAFAVEPVTHLTFQLKEGMTVEEDFLSAVLSHSKEKELKNKAFTLLSQRAYPKKKLVEKLAQKGGKQLAVETVEVMEELGLVDDLDYAERYSRELYQRKYYAPKRIAFELKQKGISPEGIERALEQFDSAENGERAATYLGRKRFDLWDQKGKKRGYDALLRLGYSYSECREAFASIEEELGDNPIEYYGN